MVLLTKRLQIGDGMKRKLFRGEHGGATVEFAIIASLLLTIVFGIIECSILLFDKHILTNASREGARAGIVMRVPRVPDATIINRVNGYAQEHMMTFGPSNLTTTVTPAEASRVGNLLGTELKVTVTYQFDFLVLSIVGLGPITLKAETRMRME
jgi:Flp pilus assembly protein TadG